MVVINNVIKNEGVEFELCWVVNESFVVIVGYSKIEVMNIIVLENGFQFGFLGVDDFFDFEDLLVIYGGLLIGNFFVGEGLFNLNVCKVGILENIYLFIVIYDF